MDDVLEVVHVLVVRRDLQDGSDLLPQLHRDGIVGVGAGDDKARGPEVRSDPSLPG